MNRNSVALFLLAAVSATAAVRAQDDQIFGRSGTPTRGAITAVSPTKVAIQATGARLEFDTKDILKVTFGDEPAELRTARERALAGQYEDCLDELKKVNVAAISNEVIQQEVGYYTAYCQAQLALSGGGDKAAAAEALFGFVRQNPGTFHFFEAAELLGDLSYAMGKFEDAARYYGGIAKAPWPEYQMQAKVLQARSQAAAGNYAEALPVFEEVLSSGLNTPEAAAQKMHATVGKAVCLAAAGQADQGIQIIQDLIAKNDPNDAKLFGPAYNALGACYAKAGKTKEALLAYLHTDVLYFTNGQAHAEALYHLSKLWDQVNKADRAVKARSLLQSRYPGSRWATMQ